MNNLYKNCFFNIFTWFFILIDKNMWNCNSYTGKLLNIIHQYISSFIMLLGPLYGKYYENIILMFFVALGWFIFRCCFLTVITNYTCNDHYDTRFNNIVQIIKTNFSPIIGINLTDSTISRNIDYVLLFLLIGYNLTMIYITHTK